jgi:hypothetical protein
MQLGDREERPSTQIYKKPGLEHVWSCPGELPEISEKYFEEYSTLCGQLGGVMGT